MSLIDKQHQELFNAADRFLNAFIGNDTPLTEKLLLELKQYVLNHFNYEEYYMKLYGFQKFNEHQTQHYQLTKDIIDLEIKYRNSEKGINLEIMHFLNKWIINHISISDKEYVDLFKKQGH